MIQSVIFLIISYTKAISTSDQYGSQYVLEDETEFILIKKFRFHQENGTLPVYGILLFWKISSTFKNNHPIILSSSISGKKLSKI